MVATTTISRIQDTDDECLVQHGCAQRETVTSQFYSIRSSKYYNGPYKSDHINNIREGGRDREKGRKGGRETERGREEREGGGERYTVLQNLLVLT